VELDDAVHAHSPAWLQHLVLPERHVIAHVFVEQVLALETDRHFGRDAPQGLELERVGKLGIEQGVALGRRLALAGWILVESVQETYARQPAGVTIVHTSTGAMRRDAGHIAASCVLEGGAHEVILAIDAPRAPPDTADIELGSDLDAVEPRVALLEYDLVEL